MRPTPDNLDALLAKVERGELDDLTEEQVAALADALDEQAALAERLADVAPPALPVALRDVAAPTRGEWDAVWTGIRRGVRGPLSESGEGRRQVVTARRLIRFMPAALAAAAAIALAVIWRLPSAASPPAPWPMKLSQHVEIHDLEVDQDAMPMIVTVGKRNTAEVIWVVGNGSEGA